MAGFNFVFNSSGPNLAELLIASEIVDYQERNQNGWTIKCLTVPWREIYRSIEKNPSLAFQFAENPELFEKFVAAAYDLEGFKVTLTPRSGDGGRDIIAEKTGYGAIRILDQCKAFSNGHKVSQNDVRALIGVLNSDMNASKAVLTTTSEFAAGVKLDQSIQQYVPYRLELRDGTDLKRWLSKVSSQGLE